MFTQRKKNMRTDNQKGHTQSYPTRSKHHGTCTNLNLQYKLFKVTSKNNPITKKKKCHSLHAISDTFIA